MNPKIKKVILDIEKTKDKITEMQSHIKDLDRQKTELENADIIATIRGIDISLDALEDFVLLFKAQQNGKAVPDMVDNNKTEEDLPDEE